MTIFKTTLKIVRAHLAEFIIYLLLPILMTVLFLGSGQAESTVYKTRAIRFAVFDQDKSVISQALVAYIKEDNQMVALAKDQNEIRDALFYMQVDYVLEIPAGFGESLIKDGAKAELGRQIAPDSMAPSAFDSRIERFLTFVENHHLIDPDASLETIVMRASESVARTGTVVVDTLGQQSAMQSLPGPFRFLAYTLMNLSLLIVSQTLMSFHQKPILERSLVSATSASTINRRLIASVLVIGFLAFILNSLPVLIFAGSELLSTAGLLLLFNVFCFSLVSVSVGFLAAGLFRRGNLVGSALRTIVPLVMSFFSGIFVPLELIPEGIRKIASFMPTYWYNASLIKMEQAIRYTPELAKTFLQNGLVQIAFAATFFIIYVAVDYRRQHHRIIAAVKA